MRSDKSIARLNPKTVNLLGLPGGVPEYTTSDLAARLHAATDLEFYTALAKHADPSLAQTVCGLVYREILPKLYHGYTMNDKERGRGKHDRKQGFLYQLVDLAVKDYVSDGRCTACSGTRFVKARACNSCKGTGFYRLTDVQKAFRLKITPKRFNYWLPLYNQILRLCQGWDGEARWIMEHERRRKSYLY